jgi:integrase
MSEPSRIPAYRLHKSSGHAVVTLTDSHTKTRRDVLLGRYGTAESRQEYLRVIAEWEANGRTLQAASDSPADLTVAELLLRFMLHAEKHYRHPDGTPTSALDNFRQALRAVKELYAHTPAAGFGPLALKAVRQKWVNAKLSRTGINSRVGKVKQVFKWAVGEELVPPSVYQALQAVTGLQKGRTDAVESEPVRPVADKDVEATLIHLNRHVRGLIELQRLTGCRPGEACRVRRCDIDTGGAVWLYKPVAHKTSWRGKTRVIAIGPKAQEVLKEFFTPNLDDYLFSPRRAVEECIAERSAKRKTPFYPSHARRNEKKRKGANRKRAPRERYTSNSYAYAIRRAAKKAGVGNWHPHQLRHSHATIVRKEFGLEHAGATLGHAKLSATEIYAERDAALAVTVAAKLG